ncbi:Conserved WD40 repeat-containing protein [Phaffia rhodozyma]|uniref:Conserved WD40 repeat-containing protein n=1 Tax=Phaffia rhodozyma TaxID=264483 RepID=A0A0F7SVK6_PHARH|nr:Conserved WD40 repeat-containing protein [Phaffia rhodozyma]
MVDLTSPMEPPSRLAHTLSSHIGSVNIVRYNAGAKYCLSGGTDRTIRLWNPTSGKEIKCYKEHAYEVLGICVTPDNSKFASCGGDKSVLFWDVTTGSVIRKFQRHTSKVNAVDFNADASVLASGSYDSTLSLWDLKSQSRAPLQTLTEAKDSITSVTISGTVLMTGSVDGYVREYDLRMGELRSDYIGHPITSLTVSPTSNTTVLVTTLDSTIRLLDRTNGKVLASFQGHKNESYRSKAAFLLGESGVVCGDEDGKLWGWGVLDSKPLSKAAPRQIHSKAVLWVETNPIDKDEMLTAGADGSIKVWRR